MRLGIRFKIGHKGDYKHKHLLIMKYILYDFITICYVIFNMKFIFVIRYNILGVRSLFEFSLMDNKVISSKDVCRMFYI